MEEAVRAKPLVIPIIGRPNVGKSSLFNRLTQGRNKSLTYDYPGVTRDRHYGSIGLDGGVILVDTGGFYPDTPQREGPFFGLMERHAKEAVEESDLVLLVVDCRQGLLPLDSLIAEEIRKAGKVFWVVVNKFDSHKSQEGDQAQFYGLGNDDLFAVSAAHGLGIGELKEAIVGTAAETAGSARSKRDALAAGQADWTVAIIGAPNAGKSTFFNRMLGFERALVSPVAGTTIDPVEGYLDMKFPERQLASVRLMDTAGVAKKKAVGSSLEEQSIYRTFSCITRCDAVVYLVDATKGIGHQDKRLMGLILERGKSLIIGLNKMDILEKDFRCPSEREDWFRQVEACVPWADFCKMTPICAQSGKGLRKIRGVLGRTLLLRGQQIPTANLNKFLAEAAEAKPFILKGSGGGKLKIRYASMVKSDPPTILLFSNRAKGIADNYRRYLVKGLRKRFEFDNTPIHLIFRTD